MRQGLFYNGGVLLKIIAHLLVAPSQRLITPLHRLLASLRCLVTPLHRLVTPLRRLFGPFHERKRCYPLAKRAGIVVKDCKWYSLPFNPKELFLNEA
ncbi:MAG: hypothetical protein CFE23_05220 [Flavobacterium sp. BFFFF1]|nr:MAG: hypothetical protein CFE23_05220 [Flavobacterium sp. BFFFF1]